MQKGWAGCIVISKKDPIIISGLGWCWQDHVKARNAGGSRNEPMKKVTRLNPHLNILTALIFQSLWTALAHTAVNLSSQMLITFNEKVLKIPRGLPAPELRALQRGHLSFSRCLLGMFALGAVWHPDLFISMKLPFLFLVTVATMLWSTGRLQILLIHWVNLITVFMKHSLLPLHLLRFLGSKGFLLYWFSNCFYNASTVSESSQTT